MEFEKLSNLDLNLKKEILSDLIKDDVSYWKKILILMSMIDEAEDTELLDLIIQHKTEEIKLANKKFNLSLEYDKTDNKNKLNSISIMEKIINGSNDLKYAQACKEVLEILNHIPDEYFNKINKKFIEQLEKNSDGSYTLDIDSNTDYNSLNISNEAKELLSLISDKFWTKNGISTQIIEIFNRNGEIQ